MRHPQIEFRGKTLLQLFMLFKHFFQVWSSIELLIGYAINSPFKRLVGWDYSLVAEKVKDPYCFVVTPSKQHMVDYPILHVRLCSPQLGKSVLLTYQMERTNLYFPP